jgi:hypothetical protein
VDQQSQAAPDRILALQAGLHALLPQLEGHELKLIAEPPRSLWARRILIHRRVNSRKSFEDIMPKYHAYSAKTSDGKETVKGYSHKQMMKFVQDKSGAPSCWLVEQKVTEDGQPVMRAKKVGDAQMTVTVTHEYEEIDFADEAQARGLRSVRYDEKGGLKAGEDKPYVKTFGVVTDASGKLGVAEVEPEKPKTKTELAAAAAAEVEALTVQLAAAKARAEAK